MGDGKDRQWIVDGHNAIFALPDLHRLQAQAERQAAREALEALLRPFALELRRPLLLVYDGNEMARNPQGGEQRGLRVIFSQPPEEEADDRIVFLALQAVERGTPVTVVTNDRRSLAARLPPQVQVMGVEEFRERCLCGAPAAPSAREERLTQDDRAEIEAHFLGRETEILDRARRGAHRRERELAARYEVSTRGERPEPEERSPGSRASSDEPGHRWTWSLPSSPRPAVPAKEAPPPVAPTPAPSPPRSDPAREARKERGRRKQERRLASRKSRRDGS